MSSVNWRSDVFGCRWSVSWREIGNHSNWWESLNPQSPPCLTPVIQRTTPAQVTSMIWTSTSSLRWSSEIFSRLWTELASFCTSWLSSLWSSRFPEMFIDCMDRCEGSICRLPPCCWSRCHSWLPMVTVCCDTVICMTRANDVGSGSMLVFLEWEHA